MQGKCVGCKKVAELDGDDGLCIDCLMEVHHNEGLLPDGWRLITSARLLELEAKAMRLDTLNDRVGQLLLF